MIEAIVYGFLLVAMALLGVQLFRLHRRLQAMEVEENLRAVKRAVYEVGRTVERQQNQIDDLQDPIYDTHNPI